MAADPQQCPGPADALIDEVAVAVRRATGIDDSRSLPVDEPLGALGLDSLSIVNAVAAVEGAFACELPDSLWEDRRGISIASIAEAVDAAPVGATPSAPRSPSLAVADGNQPGVSRAERLFLQLEARGVAGRSAAHALHRAVIGAHWVRSRQAYLVLERELSDDLPRIPPPAGITIAAYDGASAAPLAGMWPETQAGRMGAHLRRRMQSGILCLAAWEDGQDVATRPGTCFGLGLYERRASRCRGIGLALLSASLPYARDLGFARQATIVLERNLPMIAAATQVLGFAVTGRAERSQRLGRVTWKWRRHGSICTGSRLFV
jgi:acyl carrier protein/GNAT superfamily N-acetyltransferase